MTRFAKFCRLILAATLVLSGPSNVTVRTALAAADDEAGSDKGRFSVTSSGGAIYTIKVQIPPGVQGYEPVLSFGYNSTSQNGLVGVGWNLSGFSKISRVRKIIAIDGVDGDITYGIEDRFAFNGKRLLVMSGAYGSDGSVYRAELDNFDQVTAKGASGTGPQSFVVQQPNGETLVFGGTADSRVLVAAGQETVREWLLSSQTDRNGNQVVFTYSTDPTGTGQPGTQAYPVEIAYGGNVGTEPATAANRFVRLRYEARPDPIGNYMGGAVAETTLRLSAVSTYLGSDIVGSYRLSYEASPSTGASRLTTVQLFDSEDESAKGLSPSRFTYQTGANAFAGSQTWLQGAFTPANGWDPTNNPVTLADVNGDGLVDIVGFKNGVQVALAKPAGFAQPTTWLDAFSPEYDWSGDEPRYLTDINGDGLADIVGFSDTGVEMALADAASSAFVKVSATFPYFAPNAGWSVDAPRYLADVNGDGAADIVGFDDGVQVALADGNGSFVSPQTWFADIGIRQGWQGDDLLMADVNGDGKSDVIAMNQQTRSVNVALSTGTSFTQAGWNQNYANFADNSAWSADNPRMMSDVNGDGLADLIGFSTEVSVGLSNGAGFEPPATWSSSFGAPDWSSKTPRMMTDVNGDGRGDIVGFNGGGTSIALSTGSAFIAGSWNQGSLNGLGLNEGGAADQTNRQVVDINGDGLLDVVAFTQEAVEVGLTGGDFPDLMTGIERSSLGVVAIAYKPISDPAVYSESAGAGALATYQRYPPLIQNEALPQYRASSNLTGRYYVVAKTTDSNNPAAGASPYSYPITHSYRDGQVSNTGRGWLGFAVSSHTNVSIGRTTSVAYNQTFPLIGRPQSRTISCATAQAGLCSEGDTLSLDTFAYKSTTTDVSKENGYKATLVRPSSTRSDKYQGGQYKHSLGQTFEHDSYGNRTQSAKLNLVDRTGNDLDASDNLYMNAAYQNDAASWRLGFKQYAKTTKNPSLAGIQSFQPDQDISLTRWTYDDAMNVSARGGWDQARQAYLETAYTYDAFGNRLTVARPGLAATTNVIDPAFNTYIQKRSQPTGTNATVLVSQYGYDARFGKQTLKIDANGNQFTTCYDSFGRRQLIQGPAPEGADSSALMPACLTASVTAPAGVPPAKLATLSTFSHGWLNGVPAVTQTNLTQWPQEGSTPSKQTVTYLYDGLERRYQMLTQSSDGGATDRVMEDLTFSATNKTLKSALPYIGGDDVLFETTAYDPLDRTTETTFPWLNGDEIQAITSKTNYEMTGDGVTVTHNMASDTAYGATLVEDRSYFANRARAVTQAFQDLRSPGLESVKTGYQRDVSGRVIAVEPPADAGSTAATYTYDSLGRVSAKALPALGASTFEYGANGFLAKRTQGNGTIAYAYDDAGRKTGITYPGGIAVQLSYDGGSNGLGRLASATVTGQAVDVQRAFSYDAYGSTANSTLQAGNPAQTVSLSARFDPQRRPTAITMPDGTVVGLAYSLDRLVSQSIGGVPKITLSDFTAMGQPQTIHYANGVTTTLEYTPDFGTSKLDVTAGNQSLLSETYQLDPYGYPLSVTGSSAKWSTYTRTSSFENARLTAVADSRMPNGETYQYDAAGNLKSSADLSLSSSGYLLDASSTIAGQMLAPRYDKMGNLVSTSAPSLSFSAAYDGRNRLQSFASGGNGEAAQFAYDHAGNRVWRKDLEGNDYLYLSPQFRQVTTDGATVSELVLHGALGPAYSHRASGSAQSENYLHTDARHSLTLTTDNMGAATDWFLYNAYGLPLGRAAGSPDYGFMGQPYDADTGLYYFSQRYYQPTLARFTRPDTLYSASIYRHDSANRYAFMLNNPTWGFDPSGHGLPACIIGLGGGTFGTAAGISQTIDGALQKNKLSAAGVGATTTVGGIFAASAGASACLKYYRARVAGQQNNGGNDGGNQGGPNDDGQDGGLPNDDLGQDGIPMDQLPPNPGNPGGNIHVDSDDSDSEDGSDESSSSSSSSQGGDDEDGNDGSGQQSGDGDGNGNVDTGDGSSSSSEPQLASSQSTSDAIGETELGANSGSQQELPTVAAASQNGVNDAAVSNSSSLVSSTEGDATGLEASISASTGGEVAESTATTTGVVTEIAADTTAAATGEAALDALPFIFLLFI
ncbi:FG-GAP-like repeat-containing protein [Ensifer sp. NPDC090286]|uniref:FG-GAP-like repeat-containing protein n=1 Tax=Ensifer sp. NPDC090286 TaxID=3363991 RepID=UPI00383B380A